MQCFDKFGTDIQKQDIEGAKLDFSSATPRPSMQGADDLRRGSRQTTPRVQSRI